MRRFIEDEFQSAYVAAIDATGLPRIAIVIDWGLAGGTLPRHGAPRAPYDVRPLLSRQEVVAVTCPETLRPHSAGNAEVVSEQRQRDERQSRGGNQLASETRARRTQSDVVLKGFAWPDDPIDRKRREGVTLSS